MTTGPRAPGALRTLRVQVSIALLVAAAACAYVAAKSSSEELAGAYRESGRALLATVERSYADDFDARRLARPEALRRDLRELMRLHPEVVAATVYRRGADGPTAVAARGPRVLTGDRSLAVRAIERRAAVGGETRSGGHHAELRAGALARGRGALELAYDLQPADAAVARRNRRIAIVLTVLLLGFTAFTAFVLGRGIFTPLGKLRAAARRIAAGDLESRLGWTRRDELGRLAGDFDEMARQLEEKHRRLEALALRDPLTGLANHRRFQEALVEEVERARREGQPVSLVILDIDRFKSINDAHGHPFGDAVLGAVGAALRSTLRRQGGLVARLGGDEFALVLPSTDSGRAFALAEAARTACASASPRGFAITCSAGIASFPDDAGNADALVQLADGALYWAKGSGRGRTRHYDAEHVMVVTDEQRAAFADLLTRADCVRPVFQPIVCLGSGSIVGYEALARFEGKPGLPPSWWFRQAHRFGLGHRLEAEAIRAALRAGERPADAFLSVNVSPSALGSPEVQELLPDNLNGLVLEITEDERISDAAAFQSLLENLRRRGARVAVDDAGAGYAGLQQVMRMKADVIKLDRALVTDVHLDPAKTALISALVQFGRSTGARICAEGIESLEELRTLIPLGVDYAQGFRLARPAAPWAEIDPVAREVCASREESSRVVPLRQASAG